MSTIANDDVALVKLAESRDILDVKITSPRRILAVVMPDRYHATVESIVKLGFVHVVALTAIDTESGLELQLQLGRGTIVSLKTILPVESPEIDTITDLLPGASVHEREVHDIMGIRFRNSPDQSRILLSEDWPAGVHPLRKSFTATVPEPGRGL